MRTHQSRKVHWILITTISRSCTSFHASKWCCWLVARLQFHTSVRERDQIEWIRRHENSRWDCAFDVAKAMIHTHLVNPIKIRPFSMACCFCTQFVVKKLLAFLNFVIIFHLLHSSQHIIFSCIFSQVLLRIKIMKDFSSVKSCNTNIDIYKNNTQFKWTLSTDACPWCNTSPTEQSFAICYCCAVLCVCDCYWHNPYCFQHSFDVRWWLGNIFDTFDFFFHSSEFFNEYFKTL